jgi:hypothetical protein
LGAFVDVLTFGAVFIDIAITLWTDADRVAFAVVAYGRFFALERVTARGV